MNVALFLAIGSLERLMQFVRDERQFVHDALTFAGMALLAASIAWLGFCVRTPKK